MHQKLMAHSLIYHREPPKKQKNKETQKVEADLLRVTVWVVCGGSPEGERESMAGKVYETDRFIAGG